MNKTIYKLFAGYNYEKQENWLNFMASDGWILEYVCIFRYVFRKCEPNEYNVRMEFLPDVSTYETSLDYIYFMKANDIQCIESKPVSHYVYFIGKKDNDNFNIYSDNKSKINHLNRMIIYHGVSIFIITLCNFSIFYNNYKRQELNYFLLILLIIALISTIPSYFQLIKMRNKLKNEDTLYE